MAEYIEREELLYEFREIMPDIGVNELADELYNVALDLSAGDVAEVKHGKWDCIPNTYMSVVSKDGAYHGNATTCSACHEVNPNAYKTNYRPNCGANMDLED